MLYILVFLWELEFKWSKS